MVYSLYIVVCADGSLYTGIARDVARRIDEHNGAGAARKGAKYTAARRPVRLVYQTAYPSRSEALKAELRVKRLSRDGKQRLIASMPQVEGRQPETPPARALQGPAASARISAGMDAPTDRQ